MTTVAEARRREPLPETHVGPRPSPERRPEPSRSAIGDHQHDAMVRAFAQKSGAGNSGGNAGPRTFEMRFEQYNEGALLFAKHASEANAVSADDVRQGAADDCYFMSVVAGLANDPKGRTMIERMMTPERNGLVSVAFAGGGTVEVDPRQLAFGGAHFGGGTDGDGLLPGIVEQWPAVLEAAYAKQTALAAPDHATHPDAVIADGYRLIGNKGLPESAMRTFGLRDVTKTEAMPGWAPGSFVKDNVAAGKLVVVETITSPEFGLRGDHAYTVMGIENGKVLLRDPISGATNPYSFAELAQASKRVTAGLIP